MDWKLYVFSGAGLLATYLAAKEPSRMPDRVPLAQPRDGTRATVLVSDIEQQALNLEARIRNESIYQEPARNPFRFGRGKPLAIPRDASAESAVEALPVEQGPPPLPMALIGVAIAQDAGADSRTAIFSTPSGVVLAREGDEILGRFRVVKVDESTVEFVTMSDGTLGSVTLKP
jgi:hypothetical protein